MLRALPLCACCRHYPGAAIEVTLRSFSPNRISLLRRGRRIGLRNVLFEACSAFTHVTAYTLAGSPKATPYIGGFSYFVTSIAAPIASGRSDLAGWDFHPLVKRRLITAHTPCRRFPNGNIIMESGQSTLVKQTGTTFQLQIIILFCSMFFKLLLNINGFHVIINYNTSTSFFGKAIMSIKDRI